MRHVHALVLLSATLGFSTLNCSGDESAPHGAAGTSGTHAGAPSGAGLSNLPAGAGGTAPGAVGSSGAPAGSNGGAMAGTFGAAGMSGPNGGAPARGGAGLAGSLTSAGSANAGGQSAVTGGAAGAPTAGGSAGASAGGPAGAGAGQVAGAGGGAGSTAIGPCGAVTGASFAAVAAIITTSCGTKDCHPNDMRMHTDLHNTDGRLLSRLLGSAPVSVKPECQDRPLVVPCSPETSLLMQKVGTNEAAWAGCGKRMPDDCPEERPCLSAADIETIRSWIAAGALP